MTATRDPNRLIAAYLDDGPTELARDSYEAVDERVRSTRQRTAIGPWRTRPMTLPRAIVAAAAVLVTAVVGLTLFPRAPSSGPGATGATPSAASASASASAAASAGSASGSSSTASPPVYRWPADLAAGTYATSFIWDDSLVFRFTVPAGWNALDINVFKNDRISLVFFPIVGVAGPTCASPAPSNPPVLTPDSVLTALDKLVDFDGAAVDAAVGDRPARYVTFDATSPVGCADVLFRLPEPICRPTVCGSLGPSTFGLELGAGVTHHERLWLMTVGRRVVAMNAIWSDAATPAELAELQSIIDSVRLETPLATPAPVQSGG